MEASNITRIVLTGGPCGGKSSALDEFAADLKDRGYDVYTVPEIPTIIFTGGCVYPGLESGDLLHQFESAIIKLQLQAEDSFLQIAASTGRPSVVVFDRGVLDIAAYLPREMWLSILEGMEISEASLLARYDGVVHLVTAADGAEAFYTTANNTARKETPEQAVELDRKVKACWEAHPSHVVVANDGDFAQKLAETKAHVFGFVGVADE